MTLAYDTNDAEDWGDLVEYLYGDETTMWGAVRINNDTHPSPFSITILELGNEQVWREGMVQLARWVDVLTRVAAAPATETLTSI